MNRPFRTDPLTEVFPARTPTLPPATHTNSYALGERDVLLVEPATPYEDEQAAWLAWARGLASEGRRLVGIFVTHHHGDHVGGAAVLSRTLGLPLLAHAETAARIDAPVARVLTEGDAVVLEGPEPMRLRVLHTPGHAPGHLCLFDEASGVAVVGDMVASVGTILIDPGEGDMARYLAELERLAALGATVALPAHGTPIEAPEALFRHYVAHRRAREAKVLAAVVAAGPAGGTIDALVPVAYADTSPALHPIAARSLEAHLAKLVGEGRVTRTADGGYRAATG